VDPAGGKNLEGDPGLVHFRHHINHGLRIVAPRIVMCAYGFLPLLGLRRREILEGVKGLLVEIDIKLLFLAFDNHCEIVGRHAGNSLARFNKLD
jgi:hypothetical protein